MKLHIMTFLLGLAGFAMTSITTLTSVLTKEVYGEKLMWSEISELPAKKCVEPEILQTLFIFRNTYSKPVTLVTKVDTKVRDSGVFSKPPIRAIKSIKIENTEKDHRVTFPNIEPDKNYIIKMCSSVDTPKISSVETVINNSNPTSYPASNGEVNFDKVVELKKPWFFALLGFLFIFLALIGLFINKNNASNSSRNANEEKTKLIEH